MQLLCAEKPSVARDLARVLGVPARGEHWFENGAWVITWCIGHLVELEEPAAYADEWRQWRLDALPMLPAEFLLRPSRHAAQHLRAIRPLFRDRRFAACVNACDAGREGELIFRYVYQHARGTVPVRRLWISSLTDEAIRRGFAALRPASAFDALGDAARSRSEADWLVGMNATRAVTVHNRSAGHTALYSIGRVQTPTLAMLVAREREIRTFVPRDYWLVRGTFRAGERTFAAEWRTPGDGRWHARLARVELAETVVERDAPAAAVVERVTSKVVREPPPLLFDLTSLQRTANRRFGFSAARTLELAQALYERHKVLTYPRTDSRHLPNDVAGELPAVFRALAEIEDYAPFAEPLIAGAPRPRRVFDDTKVSDHHAIIPTGARADRLDRDEQRLFDLVVRRFLGAFHPDAEIAVTEVWLRVGAGAAPPLPAKPDVDSELVAELTPPPDRYFARGRSRLVAGWQAVAGIDERSATRERDSSRDGSSDSRGDGDPPSVLPPLVEGQQVEGRYAPIAKQTTPPPRYTEATLLGAMEAAGRSIDDEALREAMKESGLGTPATRAAIIETLLAREFVIRDRTSLVPTALGIGLIEALPVASLASPELTGRWEARLSRVARGEESRAAFMADIRAFVTELVAAIRGSTPPPPPADQPPPPTFRRDKRGRTRMRKGSRYARGSQSGGARTYGSQAGGARTYGSRSGGSWSRNARSGDSQRSDLRSGDSRSADSQRGDLRSGDSRSADSQRGDLRSGDSRSADSQRGTSDAPRRAKKPRASAPNPRAAAPPTDAPRAATARANTPLDLACPRCKGALLTGSRGWGCSHWKSGCTFVVWFETCGKKLTPAQLRELVTRGKTRKAKFVDGSGAQVEGRLVLDPSASGGAARLERG